MMMLYRLVRLIETHSEALATCLLNQVQKSELTARYQTNVPPEEQDAHKKAFRFAKLLVDELMLYNKDKVATGKQQKDVYALLHEDIDKSRLAYEKKFAATPAAKVDYFHQQMVQQIGDGDPDAIGNGYPGSLV